MAANYRPGSRLEHDRNGTYQQVEDWQSNQYGAMPYEESMPVPNYIEVHGGIFPSHPRQDSSQVLPTASPALGFQVNRPRASEERPFVQSTPHQQVSLWDGTHGVVEAINPSSTYYAQNNDQILASHDVIQAPSEQTSLETFGQTYSSQEYYAHDRQCFADNCQNPLSGAVPYYTSSSVDSTSCRVVEDSYGTEESQDMHASSSNTLEWCVSTDPFSADHAYEPFRNSTLEFQEEGPWSTVNTRLERRVPYCTAERTSFVHQTGASDISSSRDGGYDNVSSASVNCLGTSVTTNFEPENMRTSLATVGQVAPIVESHHRSSELCNIAHALGRRTMVMPTSDLFDPGVGFQVPSTPRLEPDRSLRGDPSSFAVTKSDFLGVPPTPFLRSESSSPSSNANSVASPGLSGISQCGECGCEYQGKYSRSNLSRHKRLKHKREGAAVYCCEARGCNKDFRRQDARLNHYRRHHPEIVPGPAVPRGSPRSQHSSHA